MKNRITPALAAELQSRIEQLEGEDKYMKEMTSDLSSGATALSILDANPNGSSQVGTTVPRYFGAIDTYIANPSNVGVGIIARMIETDPTVLSSVQFKSLMMISKIGEYQHEDDQIEEFVRTFIKRMTEPTFRTALEAMSSHLAYGFSITEILWGLNDSNQKVPVRLKTYHPSTLAFEVDPFGDITPDGVIQFVIQYGQISNPNNYFPYFQYGFQVKNPFETPNDRLLPFRMPFVNNYGLVRIPRNKVVHHVNNEMISFGSPYGKTAVRTAHLAWQLKVFFMKQMGIAGKRQASPFIHATAPHNKNKVKVKMPDGSLKELNPIEALTEILAKRENDDSVVTGPESEGYALQAITAQMDLNQYLQVLNWLDTQIFRGFLLPSLVMTDGSAGSRSLGDKHFQVVDRIAEEEAQAFGTTVVNQLIKPAIEMNFGRQDDYGHFAQRPQNIEERERLANMFNTLANAGFLASHDKVDGDYVRSSLHLPEQDESFYVQETMPDFSGEDDDTTNVIGEKDDTTNVVKPKPHSEDGEDPSLMGTIRKEVPYSGHTISVWKYGDKYTWKIERAGMVKGQSQTMYDSPDKAVTDAKKQVDRLH